MSQSALAQTLLEHTRDVPDFPVAGVLFKDITPLFADPRAFEQVLSAVAGEWAGRVDAIAGVEARGFIIGPPIALRLGLPFIPVRKKGKLPAEVVAETYDLEYGTATIEIHRDVITPGERVLVLDDVLATGGTAAAAARLVSKCGGVVAGCAFLLELAFLDGRAHLPYDVTSVATV